MRWLVLSVLAVLALYVGLLLGLLAFGRPGQAKALVRFVPDCAVLFHRLIGDPRVSRRRKIALWLLAGYLLSPIDLVPDFLPVIGQLDDAIVVAITLRYVLRGGGDELIREHWPGPEDSLRVVLALAGRGGTSGREELRD